MGWVAVGAIVGNLFKEVVEIMSSEYESNLNAAVTSQSLQLITYVITKPKHHRVTVTAIEFDELRGQFPSLCPSSDLILASRRVYRMCLSIVLLSIAT
jgi:hypothetical protein